MTRSHPSRNSESTGRVRDQSVPAQQRRNRTPPEKVLRGGPVRLVQYALSFSDRTKRRVSAHNDEMISTGQRYIAAGSLTAITAEQEDQIASLPAAPRT